MRSATYIREKCCWKARSMFEGTLINVNTATRMQLVFFSSSLLICIRFFPVFLPVSQSLLEPLALVRLMIRCDLAAFFLISSYSSNFHINLIQWLLESNLVEEISIYFYHLCLENEESNEKQHFYYCFAYPHFYIFWKNRR